MSLRLPGLVVGVFVLVPWEQATAQADIHAHAVARASCQSGKQSESVTQAATALDRDPEDLGPRMRLADALVDQGCYQEAVSVLEAGEQMHPRSSELAGKLRDVRSLVTEQTYIEGLTQAAEAAKFQRNQLRCTKLADVTACDDALKFRPDDQQLLAAKAEALQASAPPPVPPPTTTTEAAPQTAVADTATRPKPTKRTRPAPAPPAVAPPAAGPPAVASTAAPGTAQPPVATVASLESQPARTYSNDAPPGRTN
jgi:hypothetical protein